MEKDYDVMLTGIAAEQFMRSVYVREEDLEAHAEETLLREERFSDHKLYALTDVETPIVEAIDWRKHGEKADAHFFRDMRRMAAREALPRLIEQKLELVEDPSGKTPAFERIREAQEGRHIQLLAIMRRGQPPAEAKPEIVHEPVGDTTSSQYVAEQDVLEAEMASMYPGMYVDFFGGHHAPLLNIGDVLRLQRSDPNFDDRMHDALSRINPIIRANPRRQSTFQEVSPAPNQQPARRDSERP